MGAYKIGVASRRTGLSPATLRLWEEQYGLLDPARSPGGTRVYSDADIARANLIRDLVRTGGYTLQRLRTVLDLPAPGVREALEYLSQLEGSRSDRSATGAKHARILLENMALRDATSRDQIREGRLISQVHAVLRRVARAEDFAAANSALLVGATELTGAQRVLLGMFDAGQQTLHLTLRYAAQQVQDTGYQPWSVDSLLPLGWRRSIWGQESYLEADLQVSDVPREAQAAVIGGNIRSFYSCPLIAGRDLVGVLMVASRHAHGIRAEARDACNHLARPVGPVIAYFRDRVRAPSLAHAARS